jgi:type I restriction enzyme S subunit
MWEALAMADDRKPKEQQGLPEGWKWVRLGEVAENKKFSIVDGPFGTQLHADEYIEDGEIPVVRVINLSFEGKFIEKDLVFISQQKAKQLSRSKVVPGDIIIAKTGATIGKCGVFPKSFLEGIIASSCMKVSIDKTKASNLFLLFWLVSRHGQNAIINSAFGTTRTTINISPFKNLLIPLPPLPEQRKIAQILETVDNAIEKTEKIIEKYRRIKQGLMQDLLTKGIDEKGNIRSEKTHKFKDSPIGRIPEEWEVVRLGEILKYEQPQKYIVKSEEYDEKSGVPVLTAGKTFILGYVDENEGICNDLPVILFDDFTTDSRYINFPFKVKSSATKILRARDESIDLFYVYNALQLIRLKPGSDHKRFWISEYSKMFIPLPPLSEQKRIAEILSQIDQAIEKEEKYKEKLERLKKGLMEDLLTGKVRVNKLVEGENHGMA